MKLSLNNSLKNRVVAKAVMENDIMRLTFADGSLLQVQAGGTMGPHRPTLTYQFLPDIPPIYDPRHRKRIAREIRQMVKKASG